MTHRKHEPVCPKDASHKVERVDAFDAYACCACNKWLEEPCGDASCEFCAKRGPWPVSGEDYLFYD